MTQIANIEVSRGNVKLASGVLLFLGILLFLNYGAARLSDLLAFQMWPSDVDMAVFIVFSSAVLYVVLMALPFTPGIELAVLFNLPGNVVIGDGGGIALIAGMSRLFPFPKYVLLVCLAITPVPLLFLLRALQH